MLMLVVVAAPPVHVEDPLCYMPNSSTIAESPTHEFVSDTFVASSQDLEEVREGMRMLGVEPVLKGKS